MVAPSPPYSIKAETEKEISALFSGDDYKEDFKILKQQMDFLNCAVPTLYKQYADVCEEGGRTVP